MSHRVTIRIDDSDYEKIVHWAEKGEQSISEFMADAAMFKINFMMLDYPLAPLEVQRLNQLLDIITGMSHDVKNLTRIVTSNFDSLVSLTKGDNYLLDEDGSDV